ncbi:MAG TPA: ATP-binding protein [Steroidobacteraceae bacterium]
MRLEQIVSNLLENAIKYTEPGGRIVVSLSREGDEVALRVRDNGIGLRPQDVEEIFDLFTQIDTTLARSGGGLGIGLTVVRRLVALHQGRIEVRTAGLGRGSEFIVRLPVAQRKAHPAQQPSPTAATAASSSQRVLIVDDYADSAESLALLVRSWGHEVTTARDGPAALALVERFAPDIALLDIGLPRMNGYELARQLRALARHRPLRLVAMTGYGREEDRRASRAAGFDLHVIKSPLYRSTPHASHRVRGSAALSAHVHADRAIRASALLAIDAGHPGSAGAGAGSRHA